MPRLGRLPADWARARPELDLFIRDSSFELNQQNGSRRRPDPPRNVIAQQGSLECLLTWNVPQRSQGIAGWNVYKDNVLAEEIHSPSVRTAKIKLPASTSALFEVSAANSLGVESIRVPVIGSSNSDKYVVNGTTGETGGSSPPPPPGWPSEPSGGEPPSGGKFNVP